MEQQRTPGNLESHLDELREAIAQVQVLDLSDHSHAYEEIHIKLEEALRSIDGK